MKALSIKQPWASLVATGRKTIETRTWPTKHRGKLLIVSSKTFDENFPFKYILSLGLRFGQALAVVELVECRPMRKMDEPFALCDYYPGLYSWFFLNPIPLTPFPVKGRRGIWEVYIEEKERKNGMD